MFTKTISVTKSYLIIKSESTDVLDVILHDFCHRFEFQTNRQYVRRLIFRCFKSINCLFIHLFIYTNWRY